jgi:MoCo/4Fe-4S cofactor protein with predicted Tat translocation signal
MEHCAAAKLRGVPSLMKRVFNHPPEDSTGKRYWRGYEELSNTPEFQEWLQREFPSGAAELETDGLSRRNFMRLMGASAALAGVGLSGCRRPESYIVPYTKSVEWQIPGKAVLYSTSMPTRLGGLPLVATTFEGRPTKLEGNPLVPSSNGGTDSLAQAAILNLYDPDRARTILEEGKPSSSEKLDAYLKKVQSDLQRSQGAGFALLLDYQQSPTRDRFLTAFKQRYPQADIYFDDPLVAGQYEQAVETLFGADVLLRPAFEQANVILSLDCDFLGLEQTMDGVRAFSARRRSQGSAKNMNRLYAVENRFTLTGGMSDHRLRCAASQIPAFALALAGKLAAATNDRVLAAMASQVKQSRTGFDEAWLTECTNDLVAHKGQSLVLLGSRYPAWVHGLILAMNNAVSALGSTIRILQRAPFKGDSLQELVTKAKSGGIKRLFILAGNPAYTSPIDFRWPESVQQKVPEILRLGYYEDETASGAKWHVPEAHFLESWGDQRAPDGTYLPVQPMILPLFGGWSQLDILGKLLSLPSGAEAVRDTLKSVVGGGDFEEAWTAFLRQGFVKDSVYKVASASFNTDRIPTLLQNVTLPGPINPSAIEIVFPADYKVDDGRYTNNAWLQELPDPITKLTWDNAVQISKATAKALQVEEGDLVEITVADRHLVAAVLVAPGQADFSLSLSLGYGRKAVGKVGLGTGFNAYQLRSSDSPYFATGATIRRVQAGGYKLIRTQLHHSMEGRALVREGTTQDYETDPAFAKKVWMDKDIEPNISLYSHPPLNAPNQWGMVVDLNTCIGCSACVIACQAENNIPIVGKDQVERGREMHWMRIDRYFSSVDGDVNNPHLEEEPEMVVEPMMCQHCENAPCETVCPVNATVHSEDGLNVMVYNRCIGTRYCSNNCPFKVRRFNFFNYNDRPVLDRVENGLPGFEGKQQLYLGPLARWGMDEISKLQKNPNVTVRSRGVMEKCTYCVQRIETAKISQRIKAGVTGDLTIPTDSVKSACQQACPAEAIVFGDIKDPESRVAKLRALPQNYHLLEYLNIQTRTSYLARLRNPNPKMPEAGKVGRINGGLESGEERVEPAARVTPEGGNVNG